jgi:hypothetical protein
MTLCGVIFCFLEIIISGVSFFSLEAERRPGCGKNL